MQKNKTLLKIMAIVVLVAFLAVSILSILPSFRANAKTAQDKLEESIKNQQEIQNQINSAESKKKANMASKEVIDREVNELQSSIDVIQADIDATNAKIAEKEVELKAAQKKCDEQYASYCERARLLLEKGSISYLEIVLKSDSFEDFLTRATLVQEITEYDNNKLKELQKYANKVEALKKELEDEGDRLKSLKADADAKMSTLKKKQAESQAIIDAIQSDIKSYKAALAAQEKAEAAARAEIARLSSSSTQSSYSGGAFAWPSTSRYITSSYGTRTHPVTGVVKTHTGIDIGAAHGTDIYAAADGTVIVSGWNSGGYGNYVVIDHGGGLTTLYAHCSSLLVSSGQKVSRGQVIAKCGSTGMSTGPHLHFEVLKSGSHTNPMTYFN